MEEYIEDYLQGLSAEQYQNIATNKQTLVEEACKEIEKKMNYRNSLTAERLQTETQ